MWPDNTCAVIRVECGSKPDEIVIREIQLKVGRVLSAPRREPLWPNKLYVIAKLQQIIRANQDNRRYIGYVGEDACKSGYANFATHDPH